mmetsp:Transcript_101073/g.179368  ORF Transcript_101073/g.179368 Transcript_101073/m.179368 type:complete len:206 (-) Transcript_101073:759-1376(-)
MVVRALGVTEVKLLLVGLLLLVNHALHVINFIQDRLERTHRPVTLIDLRSCGHESCQMSKPCRTCLANFSLEEGQDCRTAMLDAPTLLRHLNERRRLSLRSFRLAKRVECRITVQNCNGSRNCSVLFRPKHLPVLHDCSLLCVHLLSCFLDICVGFQGIFVILQAFSERCQLVSCVCHGSHGHRPRGSQTCLRFAQRFEKLVVSL